MSDRIVLLFDPQQRRPACVLLQAVAGCDSFALSSLFPAETWIAGGDMRGLRRLSATRAQWEQVAKMGAKDSVKKKKKPKGGRK